MKARRVVLGGSAALFLGVMAAIPVAAGGRGGTGVPVVALPTRPVSVASSPPPTAAAPPRKRIIRIVVRKHHLAAVSGYASSAGSSPQLPVAPVRVARPVPPPAPAPAPAPVATSSGSH